MNVCVMGLWHLGTVTAACLAAAGHRVVAFDDDADRVAGLSAGRPPIFEPGLEDLVRSGLLAGSLQFTTDLATAVAGADIVWIAYDTPVDDEDRADVEFVIEKVERTFSHLGDGTIVLVSSQLPVGSTGRLEAAFRAKGARRNVAFAYSPENLRLGSAIGLFTNPDRIVVGTRSTGTRPRIAALVAPFTDRVEWMSVESAEMTKHAINAFLATSIVFANEVASLCEQLGADASEVARGLKSETRIGPRAYVSPGGAFAGGTLARDVVFLADLGRLHGVNTCMLGSVKRSNDAHRNWAHRRLQDLLLDVAGKTIAVWGLTYKPGTDTLRRSSAVELCTWLSDHEACVRAHDPAVRQLPRELRDVVLADSAVSALQGASALVVATPWPEYRQISSDAVVSAMERPLVLDANRFLDATLGADRRVQYVSVGKARA